MNACEQIVMVVERAQDVVDAAHGTTIPSSLALRLDYLEKALVAAGLRTPNAKPLPGRARSASRARRKKAIS